MNGRCAKEEIVLAVFPSTKGFGFAVFEGPKSLVDWGVKHIRGKRKNAECLQKVRALLAFYHPDTLVVRSCASDGKRRSRRIEGLVEALGAIARQERCQHKAFRRADIQDCFSRRGARTKREIAQAIARLFPELELRLPPVRRIWMSEDARMSIFDAAALGMTFFHTAKKSRRMA